ncbi:hypothetical protein ALC57_15383 [Trachymyrmex cornetzi]|uniref:DUF4817 domain-containing protein n=1 Tax=Trachymyrmex cornetzi TaxID=471704 RepID=A0A195DID6_9HYME|nr:hypothetical protein ALC57_15383 [Trachymyrmex cornetzi]
MNHYQPSEIVDMLLVLGECHTNYREAARVYRDRYPDGRIVNHTTIRRLALRGIISWIIPFDSIRVMNEYRLSKTVEESQKSSTSKGTENYHVHVVVPG